MAELRRAGREDSEAVATVFLAARAQMTYLPRLHSDEETRAFFVGVVAGEAETWVAGDGEVAGFVVIGENLVQHLYVRPDRQRRGTGTALLEQAKQRRPGGLRLWLFQQNDGARRFYKRHGFRLVELTDGSGNEEGLPDALYEWLPDTALP
jgi:GNAT superfamily N-acetyltransferase